MKYDLFALFGESVKKYPDNIACQIKENDAYITYTYSRLYELSLKVAAFLIREGLAPGEKAAILLENSPFWPAIYFGIMAAGLTAVPIDTKLPGQEINNILRDSQSRILFTNQELFLSLEGLLKNILSFKKAAIYPFPEISGLKPADKINSSDKTDFIASLLYTSGTTASPKGVMLTHKNFCSNFESISRLGIVNPKDNLVSMLPLHHSYPFMVTVILPLLTGAKVTFLNSLKSENLIKCLQETDATLLVGVPQLYHLLHKAILEKIKNPGPLLSLLKVTGSLRKLFGLNLNKIILNKLHLKFGRALRFFLSGGARLDPLVASDLTLLGFDILEGYGLTETSPVVSFTPPGRLKFGSVGLPVPGVKVRIHNPGSEHIGEVLIQGPNVMQGYFKKPKETSEVLKDGWFYSGDLGYLDKKGYLFLTGRSKEVIVLSSGKNIYPEEVEAHYLKSPYIKEICVLEATVNGLSSLHAAVLPNTEYFRKTKEINIQGKIRWLLENLSRELPSYKRIMGFTILREELPKTRLGKLKRYEIKTKCLHPDSLAGKPAVMQSYQQEEIAETPIKAPHQELTDKILKFLSQELKKKVSPGDHLELDLGIDSLSRVELAIGLEKLLSISLSDAELNEIFTVKELIEKISDLSIQDQFIPAPDSHQPAWGQIIRQTPPRDILDKINLTPSLPDRALTYIILNSMALTLKIFWFLRVKGRENLPADKPYLICPNHSSFLDGFAVAAGTGPRQGLNLFFLGYSGYFQHPIVRWAVKIARLIAIDPAINLTAAMQASGYALRNNKSLCIFPEGERSIDGKIKDFKKGVGILIKETGCLAVPCYIGGSHQAWPRTGAFPMILRPIKVIFGKPQAAEELKAAGQKYRPRDDYEAISLGLREKIIDLSGGNHSSDRT